MHFGASESLSNFDLIGKFNHLDNFSGVYFESMEEDSLVPFVACGADSEHLDADMNYSLLQSVNPQSD